jgi:hypothetical protein
MSEIDSSCLVGRPEDSPEGSINPGSLTSRAARLSVEDHRRRGITNEPEKWGRRQKPFSGGSSPHSANRRWLPPAVDSSRSKAIWPLITFRRYPWGTPARSSRAGSLNQTAVRSSRIEGGSGLGGPHDAATPRDGSWLFYPKPRSAGAARPPSGRRLWEKERGLNLYFWHCTRLPVGSGYASVVMMRPLRIEMPPRVENGDLTLTSQVPGSRAALAPSTE